MTTTGPDRIACRFTETDREHILDAVRTAAERDAFGETRYGMAPLLSMRRVLDVLGEALWSCGGLVWADLRDSETEWMIGEAAHAYSDEYHATHAEAAAR